MAQQDLPGASEAPAGAKEAKSLDSAAKRRFLDQLAAIGSVERAAEAIAIAPLDAYAARRKDARFADGWGVALRVGYDRIEAMLIERTAAVLTGEAKGPLETPDMLFALRLLDRQQAVRAPDQAAKGGAADKTDAAILKRLAVLNKRQAAEDAPAARDNAGGAGGEDA
ncbi:hypothetical protein ACBY01_02875 [Sphingomonas sp. ac-8]|uniref:hypothetical protein n=1 Tax=Sphingomonas sp. ac-8 TaxID=3242977 RepID=UPI003A80BF65